VFQRRSDDYTNDVLRALYGNVEAIAPRLWPYEIRNCVLMGVRRQRVTRADAAEFLASLVHLPISVRDPQSYDDVFVLADRSTLTFYDASYLDLAMRQNLPLASLDVRLLRAADSVGVAIFRL
jgi:predicted nucleic acid-binding protein